MCLYIILLCPVYQNSYQGPMGSPDLYLDETYMQILFYNNVTSFWQISNF